MKRYWFRGKKGRLAVVLAVVVMNIVALVADGVRFFPVTDTSAFSLAEFSFRFGFSALVAVLFLAVGAVTWVYARDRRVAALLLSFTTAIMVSTAVQTAALRGDALLSAIGGASSVLSLLPLFALLLLFPKNYLMPPKNAEGQHMHSRAAWWRLHLLRGFLALLSLLGGLTILDYIYRYAQPMHVPGFLESAGNIYFLLILPSILVTIPISYSRSTSVRERQQVRFFLGGVLLALTPLFLLTVLPVVAGHPQYALDGQVSTIFFFVLPLSLGYSVLRYQLLVYDKYIRRTVAVLIGTISMSVLCYLIIVISTILSVEHHSFALIPTVVCAVFLSPCLWWLAHVGTDYLFFRGEEAWARRLLEKPMVLVDQEIDLEKAVELLTTAAKETFETEEVGLFLLGTGITSYRLYPALHERSSDLPHSTLIQHLHPVLEHNTLWAHEIRQHVVQQLLEAHRPLLLSDITHGDAQIASMSYYLNTSENGSMLFAPVRAQGKMIAILVLGRRGDGQPYGGPDFGIVQLLLAKFSSVLETARVTEELRTAYERQKELDKLKDQFIITTSHELRTPSTAVFGYLELLDGQYESLPDALRKQFVSKAYHSIEELVLMLNTIMDDSSVDQEVERVKCDHVVLRSVIDHVREVLDQMLTKEQRTVRVSISEDLTVLADDFRLRQVVLNLVTNALKYSQAGTAIEIEATVLNGHVEVAVRDYGLGITPDEQIHLFERFVRLERDMNSPVRGAGLGLYICRRLVQAMGGTIWIESTGVKGEGSRFIFTLPLADPPLIPSRSDVSALQR